MLNRNSPPSVKLGDIYKSEREYMKMKSTKRTDNLREKKVKI